MLKKYKVLLLIVPFLISLGNTNIYAEQSSWKDWSFYQPIEVNGTSQYKAVLLTNEIYEDALSNLADLRVVDQKEKEVPYYIEKGTSTTEKKQQIYQSEIIAKKQKDNNTIIDFKIEPIREDADILGNMVRFTLPNQDFLKHIRIQGSFDDNHWSQVTTDYVYRTDRYLKNEVQFQDAYKFSYYRITILDNAEQITIPSLQLVYQENYSKNQEFEKEARLNHQITQEQKTTTITIHNPQHEKIKNIHLEVDGNFQRDYSVYNGNSQFIVTAGTQELYNLHFKDITIANTDISFTQPIQSDKLTVKIENNDNPPIQIKEITETVELDKIVFEDSGNGPYKLYCGNPNAIAPKYDVTLFKNYIEKETQDIASLGAKQANQEKSGEEPGLLKRINEKLLFNIIIIAISLFLIVILLKKLKNHESI